MTGPKVLVGLSAGLVGQPHEALIREYLALPLTYARASRPSFSLDRLIRPLYTIQVSCTPSRPSDASGRGAPRSAVLPGRLWINGWFDGGVSAQEMGHNYGLYHSHALDCGSVVIK